jgi:hypothetical protein
MNLNHAIVNVTTPHYQGPAVVQHSHGDDTVTVLEELSGHQFRVHKTDLTLAPVTEQAEAWIVEQLTTAWLPFFQRLAHHIAQRLLGYGKFGEPAQVEALFHRYLREPGRVLRELGAPER